MQGKEAVAEYLREHAIQPQLEAMLNQMLLERPEDTSSWIAAHLSTLSLASTQAQTGASAQQPVEVKIRGNGAAQVALSLERA
jgi:hypothetical protein